MKSKFNCRFGQKEKCKIEGCAFEKAMLQSCNKRSGNQVDHSMGVKKSYINGSTYYWSCKDGLISSNSNKLPVLKPKKGYKYHYLGWTTDVKFPKKMSTGRILYEPKLP